MIKCSKGNVEIKGNLILLEAETVMILRGIRNILEEEYGKKHAEKSMQKIVKNIHNDARRNRRGNKKISTRNSERSSETPHEMKEEGYFVDHPLGRSVRIRVQDNDQIGSRSVCARKAKKARRYICNQLKKRITATDALKRWRSRLLLGQIYCIK